MTSTITNTTPALIRWALGPCHWPPRTVPLGLAALNTGGSALLFSLPPRGTRGYHLQHHPAASDTHTMSFPLDFFQLNHPAVPYICMTVIPPTAAATRITTLTTTTTQPDRTKTPPGPQQRQLPGQTPGVHARAHCTRRNHHKHRPTHTLQRQGQRQRQQTATATPHQPHQHRPTRIPKQPRHSHYHKTTAPHQPQHPQFPHKHNTNKHGIINTSHKSFHILACGGASLGVILSE